MPAFIFLKRTTKFLVVLFMLCALALSGGVSDFVIFSDVLMGGS
jgi:preprotein translocase subunit SecG